MTSKITISVHIRVPIQTVWELWTNSEHIKAWNNVDATWHTPQIDIDLRNGGKFLYRMESKDGNQGFDYKGTFDLVIRHQRIEYTLDDGRKTVNTFTATGGTTQITESFDPEKETPVDEQESFCFRILQSFKNYAESTISARTN